MGGDMRMLIVLKETDKFLFFYTFTDVLIDSSGKLDFVDLINCFLRNSTLGVNIVRLLGCWAVVDC